MIFRRITSDVRNPFFDGRYASGLCSISHFPAGAFFVHEKDVVRGSNAPLENGRIYVSSPLSHFGLIEIQDVHYRQMAIFEKSIPAAPITTFELLCTYGVDATDCLAVLDELFKAGEVTVSALHGACTAVSRLKNSKAESE